MKTEKIDFGHELDLQSIFFIIGIRNRRIRLAEFKKIKEFRPIIRFISRIELGSSQRYLLRKMTIDVSNA